MFPAIKKQTFQDDLHPREIFSITGLQPVWAFIWGGGGQVDVRAWVSVCEMLDVVGWRVLHVDCDFSAVNRFNKSLSIVSSRSQPVTLLLALLMGRWAQVCNYCPKARWRTYKVYRYFTTCLIIIFYRGTQRLFFGRWFRPFLLLLQSCRRFVGG